MCIAPILVDNPYYNSPIRDPTYNLIHDTKHAKMPVPCGRCSSCVHLKQVYMVQRMQMESINHDLFYGTLTYNQESLPIATYGDISFAYPDYSDWQKMMKMIRGDYPDLKFKYMLVSEYGGKKHRPHYHFVLSLPKTEDKRAFKFSMADKLFHIILTYWRRNYGSRRSPDWHPLLTYRRVGNKYNYDLHWLDPNTSDDGLDGVSFYVTKYIMKYDSFVDKFKSKLFFNLSASDYSDAWLKFKPRILLSKGFGSPNDPDVQKHIVHGINFALATPSAFYPYYVSRYNGSTYPLCPYYQKRFLTVDSQAVFCSRRPDNILTDSDIFDFDNKQDKFLRTKNFLSSRANSVDYDDITNINETFDYGKFETPFFMDSDFANSWQNLDFDSDCLGDDCDDILFE